MFLGFPRRLAVFFLLGLTAAVAQHWYLWRFVFRRPSLLDSLRPTAQVTGLGVFDYRGDEVFRRPLQRVVSDAALACNARPNACMDYGVVVTAFRLARTANIPEVTDDVLRNGWKALQKAEPIRALDESYVSSSLTGRGVVLQFNDGGRDELIVARHTAPIANDRYSYSEALVRVGEDNPRRSFSFRFDVAGLEFLTLPVLMLLNVVFAMTVLIAWIFVKWLRYRLSPTGGRAPRGTGSEAAV